MIDTRQDQGIAQLQYVRAIIEQHLESARNDDMEVERVGMVHRMFDVGRHLEYQDVCMARCDPGLVIASTSGRPLGWRRLSQLEDVGAMRWPGGIDVAILDRHLTKNARAASIVNAGN
jgi:hypothetical protein